MVICAQVVNAKTNIKPRHNCKRKRDSLNKYNEPSVHTIRNDLGGRKRAVSKHNGRDKLFATGPLAIGLGLMAIVTKSF